MKQVIIEKSWHKATDKHAITFEQIKYIDSLAYKKGVELPFLSQTNTMRSYTKEDAINIIDALTNNYELIFEGVENRGGANRNQGRKLKYGEETIKVNYRIPLSKKEVVDNWISEQLEKWQKESKK